MNVETLIPQELRYAHQQRRVEEKAALSCTQEVVFVGFYVGVFVFLFCFVLCCCWSV
jgi:hypothetical protein